MTELLKFDAQLKENTGTGVSRAVRNGGMIPAIIYGENKPNIMLSVPFNKFKSEYEKGNFKTKLVELHFGKEVIKALPIDIQFHPVTDAPIHVDFRRVDENTMVKMSIRIKIVNEDKSPGMKKGGVLNLVHRAIDMKCKPAHIPAFLAVDIAGLEIGQNIHIEQIQLPQGAEVLDKTNFTIVTIAGRAADEPTPATATAAPAAK